MSDTATGIPQSTLPQELAKVERGDVNSLAVFIPAEELQREFQSWIEACDPEVLDAMAAELAGTAIGEPSQTDEVTLSKRDRVVTLMEIQQGYVDRLRLFVRAVEERARHEEAKVKRAKWSILTFMQMRGVRAISGLVHRFVIRNASGLKLRVVNESMIPAEYFEEVLEPKRVLNKAKLELDLGSGKEIPGALLEPAQPTLLIK